MIKHTPAPWGDVNKPVIVRGCTFIAHAHYDTEEGEANTRLIKAAPDLLEALRIAERFMGIAYDWNIDEAEINGEMRSTYHWLEIVRAAILKATQP